MNTASDDWDVEPVWLTFEEVSVIHEDQLARYGGLSGTKSDDLVHGAIAAPRNLLGYDGERDLLNLAARLCQAITKAHGFVDGNKRTAAASLLMFLAVNGYYLDLPEDEDTQPLAELVEHLAADKIDFRDLADEIAPYIHAI